MINLTLDWETHFASDYSLKRTTQSDLSTSQYVYDKRFYAQVVGLQIENDTPYYVPHSAIVKELEQFDWGDINLIAHHQHFDGLVLAHHYGITPKQYSDTLGMARAILQGVIKNNDLNSVARYLGIEGKTSGVLGKVKGIRKLPIGLEQTLGAYCINDTTITKKVYDKLVKYMATDELELIDLTIRMFCRPLLEFDRPRARKALAIELINKRRLIQLSGAKKKQLGSNQQFADLLTAEGADIPKKISPTTKKEAFAFAKTDMGFIKLETHPNEKVRHLVAARKAVKSTITETRIKRIMDIVERSGGKFPVYLNYWGAHPGRWSGADKTNPQNFTRGSELRKSLLAPPGQVLVVADSAQIECRTNAGISGQEDLLEAFRQGRDVYNEFASTIYGRPVFRKRKENEEGYNPEDYLAGCTGKIGILGLGWNMAGPKFQHTLAVGAMGPPVWFELHEAYRIVSLYRAKNHRIQSNWKYLQSVLFLMTQANCDIEYAYGVRFTFETCHLPNGMRIWYPGLHVNEEGNFMYRSGRKWKAVYGGLFAENISQALARIIVAEQMIIIGREYPVVLMTHDEIVAAVDEDKADAALKFMLDAMKETPAWCQGLPLSAEGGFAKEYSK